ncbi:hypothetical protein FCG67_03775 [Rhodococcus oryzae]|uniref:Uncharacterized protein n=1 Tax=Rhodococcus oryzae TaxID=2571143 RepID=A0ABY2RNU8_9NOCA|nr:hypothetical protein [Rhodococcus oryzae]TJZ80020.1 hypothetical protein FCG67_03775 [Rhodococcus oryzae]
MTTSEPSAESDAAALESALSMLDPRYARYGGIGLELDDDGLRFRVWGSVETGGTDYRSVGIGDQIYTSDQPERRLESGPVFSSTDALLSYLDPDSADPAGGDADSNEHRDSLGERNRRDVAQNWPQAVRDIIVGHAERLAEDATRILLRRPPLTERACTDCAGTGQVLGECMCIHLGAPGIIDLDAATAEPVGTYEPNQDCSTCAGTGHYHRHCYDCGGTGVLAGPIPTTITIAGGALIVIDGQPAALAHRIPVTARCSFGPREVVVRWSVDSKSIIDQALTAAGLDPQRIVVRNNNLHELEIPRWAAGIAAFRAVVEDGRIEKDPPSDASLEQDAMGSGLGWFALMPTAEHIATGIEASLLADYRTLLPGTLPLNLRGDVAARIGVDLDARGVPVSRALSFESMPTIRQLLIDVAESAAARGLHAVLTMDFIATGEWGPAVTLLDSDLTLVAKGTTSYTIEHALLSCLDGL